MDVTKTTAMPVLPGDLDQDAQDGADATSAEAAVDVDESPAASGQDEATGVTETEASETSDAEAEGASEADAVPASEAHADPDPADPADSADYSQDASPVVTETDTTSVVTAFSADADLARPPTSTTVP
jgi:hypothetical protein